MFIVAGAPQITKELIDEGELKLTQFLPQSSLNELLSLSYSQQSRASNHLQARRMNRKVTTLHGYHSCVVIALVSLSSLSVFMAVTRHAVR